MILPKLFPFHCRLNISVWICVSYTSFRITPNSDLFVYYRPRSSNIDVGAIQYVIDLCDCIDCFHPNNAAVVICGDFNLPSTDCSTDNCSFCSNVKCFGVFLDFYFKHGFHQCVDLPTWFEISVI